ncbi:MAG TPA: hypothetical protein VJQ85_04245 [Gaiellaceae bacterium]|nr:hypothetical protein [Gaiellaceae bacterium]
MADPVAWTMIEPGWSVVDASGEEIGTIAEVEGDENLDIFDGIKVRKGMDILSEPRYIPAEQVGRIEVGTVHLV